MIAINVAGVSDKLQKKLTSFNNKVAKLQTAVRTAEAAICSLPDDAETESLDRLRERCNECLAKQVSARQKLLQLSGEARELHAVALEETVANNSEAASALEAARAKVVASLRRSGITPESDPRFQFNPRQAEGQFARRVDEAKPVREAQARFEDSRIQLDLCRKLGGTLEAAVNSARQELKQFVRSTLAVHG